MSIHKKRRKCPKTSKTILSKNYFLKHKFEGDSRPTEISLGTSDNRIAQQRATEYISKEEQKRSGLYVTDQQRSDGAQSLQSLTDQYIEYLIEKGTQRDHYRKVKQRITDGLADLGWSSMSSINKRQYQEWIRSQSKWSKKTQSHYQTAFKAFFKWLMEEDYLVENPFQNVRGIKGIAESAPPVAALTSEEARTFLASCPQYRQDFYALMICTGLRAIEVDRLRVGSVRVDGRNRYWIALNREESKARRDEFLEVPLQLEPLINRLIEDRNDNLKLLARGRPTRRTFRLDLQRAGIEKVRFDGSCITLHSLRKTFVTLVNGVSDSPAATQRLARHTSSDLTELRYTDRKALNHHDILDKLPNMLSTSIGDEDGSTSPSICSENGGTSNAA
tara:strand:- start:4630 stop:5799 length:1170 start_codon:yes stop_codon:yes gene_type:complete